MTKMWMIAVVMVPGLAVAAAQTPADRPPAAAQSAPAPSGNAEAGKKLFVSYGCYQCHGYEGQGGVTGPRLAPKPVPFAAFSAYVRRPTNQMPPYTAKVVSDADLTNIHAYLQSRPEPSSTQRISQLVK